MTTKAKITAIIAAAAFILLIRLIFFGGSAAGLKPVSVQAGQDLTYAYDSGASFYSYNSNGFFFCTKDGVKYLSSKGVQQWEEVINLTSPVLYGKCDFLAVGESNGRAVYVFNTLGKTMECSLDAQALNFSVNRNGDLTVILQTSSGYRVETYEPGKDEAVWYYEIVEPNMYPISADTSPDGKVTAISVLDLSPDAHNSMTTQIMFMYTDKSDMLKLASADGVFAGETLPDQIARVYFMDNRLLAVSDKYITAYSVGGKDKVKQDWQLVLANKISQFSAFGEAGFSFITGDPLPGSGRPSEAGILNFYNMDGRRTGKYAFGGGADYLSMNWGGAIVGNGGDFTAVNNRGGVIWQYKSLTGLKQLIFLDNENTALSVGSTSAYIMRRGA